MNDQLRKSMNVRNHFRRKWERVDSKENHVIYVKHRNSTMRLRKQSMFRRVSRGGGPPLEIEKQKKKKKKKKKAFRFWAPPSCEFLDTRLMLSYLQKNCINTTHFSSKQYWTILKPFMSNKGASRN